jgi:hypothetical protein
MIFPDDVTSIYQRLLTNSIQVWLTGGWGIDALLGKQTRPYKDPAGKGMIAGFAAQYLTPEMQVLCHTGYELPDNQLKDFMAVLLENKREVRHTKASGSGVAYSTRPNVAMKES